MPACLVQMILITKGLKNSFPSKKHFELNVILFTTGENRLLNKNNNKLERFHLYERVESGYPDF